MFVNGEVQGYTLAPVGCPQPKVVDTNPKETVTAFLAGVYDLGAGEVYPLHPTVIFEHGAKRRESSTIYSEMTSYANKLKGIFIDVSSSGWVRDDIYPRMMHRYLPLTLEQSSTAIVTDDFTGHRTDDIPVNCDPHTIPGGCTKTIQIHDRVFNRLFKRAYNELLSAWRIQNSSCKVTRYLVLEWIKEAHSRVWVKHHNTILNAARRYIKQPATEYPWSEKDPESEPTRKAKAEIKVREEISPQIESSRNEPIVVPETEETPPTLVDTWKK